MPPSNWATILEELRLENSNLRNVLQHNSANVSRLTKESREARGSVDRLRRALIDALRREDELKEKMELERNATPEVLTSDVYRCSVCTYEVVDGYCQGQGCGLKHTWPPAISLPDNCSVSTNTQAIHPDRSLVSRGDTPLRDVDEHDCQPPKEYRGRRRSEYRELLGRGATRLMCETFHLEFAEREGIYAWADWEIYHDFAGPHMRQGDFWKILLGRRIQLDEDDLDGSIFIEGLLEDALMFPMCSRTCKRTYDKWVTIEERPGIWVTRLAEYTEDESENSDSVLSEEESDSSDEDGASHSSASDGDRELENPPEPGIHALNAYSSGDDMDTENDEIIMSDDDDSASHDSVSDSDDGQVYDTAFMRFTGPDGVWDLDMDGSEDSD